MSNPRTLASGFRSSIASVIAFGIMALPAMGGVEADILVGYTAAAEASRGGEAQIIAQIRQGILNTNLAHERSQTDATVTERMIAKFSITEDGRDIGGMIGEWRRQRGGDSFGQSQAYWESFLGIDISMIVSNVNTGSSNGQAETPGVYSSVRVSRLTQPTFPHELGHNYSAIHEQGHTYSTGGGSRRTLLSSAGGNYGSVINNYSNPAVTEQGGATGTSSANNALRVFNQRFLRQNVRARNSNPSPSDPQIQVDPDQTSFDYDLGLITSPVQSGGWIPITPETGGDVSWSTAVSGIDRGSTGGVNQINQDFVTSTGTATLNHKLGRGIWKITITTGDVDEVRDFVQVSAEGGQVVRSNITNAAGSFFNTVFDVAVVDGELNLEFSDGGGNPNGWAVTRLSIDKVTDPGIDEDEDNLSDVWEYAYFDTLAATSGGPSEDFDNDMLTDREECESLSDPTLPDGDSDGLSDFDEVRLYLSNPLNSDSDFDSFYDAEEVAQLTNPNDAGHRPRIPGLVAYYRFDEASGSSAADTANDGNPENATQSGNIDWTTTAQRIGTASLDLDGSSFLTVATPFSDTTTELTMSVWVNPDTDGGYKGIYSGRGDSGSTSLGNWGVNVESRHGDFRYANGGGGSTGIDSPNDSVLSSGGWYHLAMTWTTTGSASTGKIYVNGSLVNSSTSGLAVAFVQPALGYFIGNDPAVSGRIFDGQIDDLAVFDRALSDSEILEIRTKGLQGLGVFSALLPSGSDPVDRDGDSLTDSDESTIHGTDPLLKDSDGDGFDDGQELAQRSDPNSADSTPLISGLAAYYPFDEGSGDTAFDLAPGGVAQDATQEEGVIGWTRSNQKIGAACLDLDGNSYLGVASAVPPGTTVVTMSAWVNPAADGGYKGIYSGRGNEPTTGLGNWGINVEDRKGDLRFANDGGSSAGVDTPPDSVLAADGWHHLAMTWETTGSSSIGKVYLDGVLVGSPISGAALSFIQPARGFFIGTDPVLTSRRFTGQIDDLAIFTRLLSDSEVAAIHSAGQQGRGVLSAVVPPVPMVPADFSFTLQSGASPRDVSLSWSTQQHAIYDVFGSTDLDDWDIIAEGLIGSGSSLDFVDEGGGDETRKFYKVQQR